MKKDFSKYLWAVVLVLLGLFVVLKSFNLVSGSIFFDGWWSLFIIIPAVINLFTNRNIFWDASFLLIGVGFLMAANEWFITYDNVWAIALCLVLINIAISIIRGNKHKKAIHSHGDNGTYIGIFSGCDEKPLSFSNGTAVAIFGGVDLDLRDIVFTDNAYLTAVGVFGGIDVYVNDNINVVCNNINVFGGTDNQQQPIDGNKTLYIDGCAVFGGIDIKKNKKK